MKRFKLALIPVMLLLILVVSACGSSKSEQGNVDSNTPNKEDTFLLKASIQAPQQSSLSQGFDAYLNDIESRSDGKIKFERYYSESLIKAADHLDAVSSGIADFALIVPGYTPAKNPLTTIESLAGLWTNQWAGTMAFRELFSQYPEFNEEFEKQNVKVVGHFTIPTYYVISNKEINSLEEIKGLKVVAAGGQTLTAEALGAVSVGIVMPEIFEAMERGTVDGGFVGLTSSSTYGVHELAKSIYKLPIGSQGGIFGLNMDVYKSLPPELQDIFDEAALKNAVEFHQIYQDAGETVALKKFESGNTKIVEPSAKDLAKFQEIVESTVWKSWMEHSDRKAYPAEEILKQFVENIEKYENEYKQNGLPE